ncbi:MAG: hypothetical protein HKP30_06640, partial [Myxococcales bacterium]|nr:hypothetical protein [Myxococcales bacterium]
MILNATFENLALLGMLLAVFGGLAAGLDRRGAAGGATDRAMLGSLLATAFGVVFFAYLPHVLYTASGSELISWRVAHGLFALWHLVVA